MTLTIIIILGLFFMTYMPQYIAVHLLRLSCKSCRKSINFYKVDVAASRFLCLSSVMNPFVYAWRVSRYRSALFECLRIIRKKLKHSSRMNDGVTVYGEQTRLETFCESHENLVRKIGKVRVVDQTSVWHQYLNCETDDSSWEPIVYHNESSTELKVMRLKVQVVTKTWYLWNNYLFTCSVDENNFIKCKHIWAWFLDIEGVGSLD